MPCLYHPLKGDTIMNNPTRAVRMKSSVDMGFGPNKAFPFIYNFINKGDDNWDRVRTTSRLANLETGLGITIPVGGTRQLNIRLDPDYNFKLLSIKYTAYSNFVRTAAALAGTVTVILGDVTRQVNGVLTTFLADLVPGDAVLIGANTVYVQSVVSNTQFIMFDPLAPLTGIPTFAAAPLSAIARLATGKYIWYDEPGGWFQEQGDYQTQYGTPLLRFLLVSVSSLTDSRYLMGGPGRSQGGFDILGTIPAVISSLQGYEYATIAVREPYLLPKNGQILLQLTNMSDIYPITVGGGLFGMKVRI